MNYIFHISRGYINCSGVLLVSKGDILPPITAENMAKRVFQELDVEALQYNLITVFSVLFLLLGNVDDASRCALYFQAL